VNRFALDHILVIYVKLRDSSRTTFRRAANQTSADEARQPRFMGNPHRLHLNRSFVRACF
jgi:hypothetical protein